MTVLKIILSLMIHRAPLKQYYLNVGSHLLKKGAGYEVGQIVKEKCLRKGLYRVSVITGLFYNFQENKVSHTADKKIMKVNDMATKKN